MAVLTTEARNALPDSAFACITGSGDSKERKYPHHSASGAIDLPHLRNALSRLAQDDTTSCGAAHLRAHAKAEGIGQKAMIEVKASLIDNDHFRLLAIPFGGPIKGRDLDGEYFTKRTDIKADWFTQRPVLWHHGSDALMGDAVVGKATDLTLEEDGWWVDVWLEHGQKRADLIKRLAARAPLYGSSGTIGYLKKASLTGEILTWPYVEQTLTTSPQNSYSVLRPAKAVLEDFDSAEIPLDGAFKAWLGDLDALGADLTPTSGRSAATAKAGRVLSALSERRLREALAAMQQTLDELAAASQSTEPLEVT
jgi:hypothetical protein